MCKGWDDPDLGMVFAVEVRSLLKGVGGEVRICVRSLLKINEFWFSNLFSGFDSCMQ